MGRKKDKGLGPDYFFVSLPPGVHIVTGPQMRLIVDTPAAAEIIMAIADGDSFLARLEEKNALRGLGRQIAERYSGHPTV